MTAFIIGGKPYTAAPLKFKGLKKAWPYIMATQGGSNDPFEVAGNVLRVIAIATNVDYDLLEEDLEYEEMEALSKAFVKFLEASGLTKKGEARPAAKAKKARSTGTSTE